MAAFFANALVEGSMGVLTLVDPTIIFGKETRVGAANVLANFWGAAVTAQALLCLAALFRTMSWFIINFKSLWRSVHSPSNLSLPPADLSW